MVNDDNKLPKLPSLEDLIKRAERDMEDEENKKSIEDLNLRMPQIREVDCPILRSYMVNELRIPEKAIIHTKVKIISGNINCSLYCGYNKTDYQNEGELELIYRFTKGCKALKKSENQYHDENGAVNSDYILKECIYEGLN